MAENMGTTFKKTERMLKKMSKVGKKAGEVGIALRKEFIKLIKANPKAIRALSRLGIKIDRDKEIE